MYFVILLLGGPNASDSNGIIMASLASLGLNRLGTSLKLRRIVLTKTTAASFRQNFQRCANSLEVNLGVAGMISGGHLLKCHAIQRQLRATVFGNRIEKEEKGCELKSNKRAVLIELVMCAGKSIGYPPRRIKLLLRAV